VDTRYLASIKSSEGFTREAKWDYAQHSNGFGTKAQYPGEQISPAVAEQRFMAEIAQARQFVEQHAAGWDEGTKAALTSLTFNAGTRWATSGLGEAVRNLDIEDVKSRFLAYTKAGGKDLPGLVARRLAEAAWIGTGETAPSHFSGDPARAGSPTAVDGVSAAAAVSANVTRFATTEQAIVKLEQFGIEPATTTLSSASTVLLLLLEQELSRKKEAETLST